MNKIAPKTLKGFRDFLPNEMRKRQFVIDKLKTVFASYGFEPLETPALEYAQILTGKYGEEGDKLMYKFKDNGQRDVALRYDQTVPLARVVAQYGSTGSPLSLPMPFKRYQIQNVWRAENTQRGRFREFLQSDIDTVGTDNVFADVEIIACAVKCLETLGFKDYKVLINDRSIFKDIPKEAITIIDKLKKIGDEGVRNELGNKGLDEGLLSVIKNKPATALIQDVLSNLSILGIEPLKAIYEPTLARGLDYYTGLIIEVEIDGYSGGSVGGGGRYDNLIGMFSDKQIPAVGFAFGFDRLIEAMEELNLFPNESYTTKVLILSLEGMQDKSFEVADKLRNNGVNTEVYLDSNIEKGKQFIYADKKGIPYTLTPKENSTFELGQKNMQTGEITRQSLTLEKLLELFSK